MPRTLSMLAALIAAFVLVISTVSQAATFTFVG